MNTQTSHLADGHLSDEQWTAALSGEAQDQETEGHLRNCVQCSSKEQELRNVFDQLRNQVSERAERPAAFWQWQLEATLKRIRPRRLTLGPVLAGTLALLGIAVLLVHRPAATASYKSHMRATATVSAPTAVISAPSEGAASGRTASAESGVVSIRNHADSVPSDAALMAEVERTLQSPPAALEPAALLAQELLSAQITASPEPDSTSSKGEVQ
jgi:hypothetical protein